MIWECSRIRFDLIDDPIGWSQIKKIYHWLFFRSEIKRPSPEEIRKVREQELEEDLAIANVSTKAVAGSNLTNCNLFNDLSDSFRKGPVFESDPEKILQLYSTICTIKNVLVHLRLWVQSSPQTNFLYRFVK